MIACVLWIVFEDVSRFAATELMRLTVHPCGKHISLLVFCCRRESARVQRAVVASAFDFCVSQGSFLEAC